MRFFDIIEFTMFILAFLASIYMAIREGFAKKNIVLVLITLLVLSYSVFQNFWVFEPGWLADNRLAILNTELLLEVALYLILYIFLLKNKRYQLLLICYLLFFLMFFLIFGRELQPINENVSIYSYVFGAFGVLIGILLFFHEKLNESEAENIFRNFWFWISAGLFIFLATEIPIMSLLNYLSSKDDVIVGQTTPIWNTKQGISLFYYLMYLVGILCRTKT